MFYYLISKIYDYNFFKKIYFSKHYTLYYIYWILKIINKKYISYDYQNIKFYLWKKLTKFQIYPKDVNYYYRLYYATKNLTWFYSLRKQRKIRRIKIFNYIKFFTSLHLKKIFIPYFNYDFYFHRTLMHKHIFKKVNFFLYYKQIQIKKFLKINKNYKLKHPFFFKNKFLKMFNKVRIFYDKPIFNMYKHHFLRIFKESRQTHWTATTKETLNKRTYCNFLPKFIKNQNFLAKTALMLVLQQIKLTYSWKHSIYLINFFFLMINL